MNWISPRALKNAFCTAVSGICLVACAAQPSLVKETQSGFPEARFRNTTVQNIRDELALRCTSTGAAVESSEYSITCSKRNESGRGVMAQAMLGNACSDTPLERIEFTTVQTGSDVFVTARGWMQIKKCFGDTELIAYDKNNNFRNQVQAGLDRAVSEHERKIEAQLASGDAGSTIPSADSEAVTRPTPGRGKQTRELDPAKRCDACQQIGRDF